MGAWDTGVYDNDDAADWCYSLASDGLAAINEALNAVQGSGYVEAPEGSAAVAAADVVGRMRSGGGDTSVYSEDVRSWLTANSQMPSDELVERALQALAAARGEQSELIELWSENPEDRDAWLATIDEIVRRLTE